MPAFSGGAQHTLLQLQEEVKPWLLSLYSNASNLSQFVALAEYFPPSKWLLGGIFPGAVLFFPLRAAGAVVELGGFWGDSVGSDACLAPHLDGRRHPWDLFPV